MMSSVAVRMQPTDEFVAREGFHLTDDQARVVGTWLENLGPRNAQEIVEAARLTSAPTAAHERFTWDDERCGVLWRRHEARTLARSIAVKVIKVDADGCQIDDPPLSAPAFYSMPPDKDSQDGTGDRNYVSIKIVEQREDYRQQVIKDATRELISRRRKFAAYQELFAEEAPALRRAFDSIAELEEDPEGEDE